MGAGNQRPPCGLHRDLAERNRRESLLQDLEAAKALFGGKTGRIFKNGGDGDHRPAIEIYRCNRFSATTDRSIGCEDLRVVSVDDVRWIIEETGPRLAGEKTRRNSADNSRSGRASRAGVALKAAGVDYDEMRAALLDHDDPGIADWARTRGLAKGEREMHRIFDKAGEDSRLRRSRLRHRAGRHSAP